MTASDPILHRDKRFISDAQLRIATIKLELDSARHVLAVIGQKPISMRYPEDLKIDELAHYKNIEKHLIDELFELEILLGDQDE